MIAISFRARYFFFADCLHDFAHHCIPIIFILAYRGYFLKIDPAPVAIMVIKVKI